MKRTFLNIFLSLLPWSTGFLVAQTGDLRGAVSDSLTGERIPFANVLVVGTQRGAAANSVGFYLIPSLPPGIYEVTASAVGFVSSTRHVTVETGKPAELHFQLAPTLIETEEVLVTGQARPDLLELQTSVHVINPKEMKLTPVTAQGDVLQSLKILPGIVSTSDASQKFYVRGGAGDQNLVLLDGMKIYNPFHALGIFSIFDPDIVRSTEVYTGAFPAGYGGRLSSVVNISTRDGRLDRIGTSANLNFLSSKLQLEGPMLQGLSWMLNARKSLFSQTFTRIVRQDAPVSFYDAFFKATTLDTSGAKIEVSVLTAADDMKFPEPTQPDYLWRTYGMSVTSSGLASDRLFVIINGSWSTFRAERIPKGSQSPPSSTSVKELNVRAHATYYSDLHDFYIFGFDLAFPRLEYNLQNNLGITRRIAQTSPEASMWSSFQSSFGNVQLSAGLHLELGSLFYRPPTFDYLQPRLNLSYLMAEGWRAKFSFGTYTQNVLTVNNEDDVISLFDAWVHVPRNLHSQQSNHYVIGLEGKPADQLSTTVELYLKENNSLVTYNPNKVDAVDPDYINSSGTSYGAEFTARWNLGIGELYATYAYSVASIQNQGLEYFPRYDRRHHVNVLGSATFWKQFGVNARFELGSGFPYTQSISTIDRLTLTGSLPGPFELETGQPYILLGPKNAARLPWYHRLDVSLTYTLRTGSLTGSAGVHIINLYDNKNIFYFDRKTGRRVNMLSFFPSAILSIEF